MLTGMTKGLRAGANDGNDLSVQEQGVGLLTWCFSKNFAERKFREVFKI